MVALMEKTGLPKKSLLKLMDQFKKIAADTKGKGKKQTTSVNGGVCACELAWCCYGAAMQARRAP